MPPWAVCCVVMSCRLVALDKCPGTRPVGIGKIWQRLITKCGLKVYSKDTKVTCDSMQLCIGLDAGIKGVLYTVRAQTDAEDLDIEFGKWELDDAIWQKEVAPGDFQDSLPL